MFSLRHSKSLRTGLISLCLVSTMAGIAATPAQAAPAKESKASQCKRLEQSVIQYTQRLENVTKSRADRNPLRNMDKWLAQSEIGLKQMQAKKFSDPKIRQLQQGLLDFGVAIHNEMTALTNAAEVRDHEGTQESYIRLVGILSNTTQLDKGMKAYCGIDFNKLK